MCVLTMPGITYLPDASITASASGQFSDAAFPMRAIVPFSTSRSSGPEAGTPVPGMTMAPRIEQALDLACVLGRRLIGGWRLAAGRLDTEKDRHRVTSAVPARRRVSAGTIYRWSSGTNVCGYGGPM